MSEHLLCLCLAGYLGLVVGGLDVAFVAVLFYVFAVYVSQRD